MKIIKIDEAGSITIRFSKREIGLLWAILYDWIELLDRPYVEKAMKPFSKALLKLLPVLALAANSCSTKAFADDPPRMSCADIQGDADLRRCENSEAICYLSSSGGLACKFK